MAVRRMQDADETGVIAMMRSLWPEAEVEEIEEEQVFVWERPEGYLGGFVSLAIRPYVDGCDIAPCPHVEGWWVAPDLRRQGVGRALYAAAEDWARSLGFTELGSDTELHNQLSIDAHQALGFELTERIQYFRKKLV